MSTTRQAAETVAQVTAPVPVGVSSLSFLGVTLKDWVFMGTGVLIVFQLIVIVPKACRSLRSLKNHIKEVINHNVNRK
ncbi:hypothetical protein GCM10007160_18420 [Litchfieldella qijiaojingensis]|uniref:Uncharacterized protein n=1 Tax=Litchfieldella qijiaojingensis TaxID=980347 RepID=A0ABQ2YSA9_9GAMM|nr:hypothetical protein GCM10007160_18420 [Halomonas qijiaojingensis]